MVKQGGEWQDGRLADRARIRRRRPEADQGRARRRRASARWPAPHSHARGAVPAGQAGARPRQREHRLPPAPARLRDDGRRRAAGSACRSPSWRRSTACSSSARSCARTIRCSRTRLRQAAQERRAGHVLHAVDDDWLMPIAAHVDRRAVATGCGAGRHRRRRRAARASPAPSRRRRDDAAKAIAAVAARRRAQGDPARQRRRAASAGVAAARARAVDRRADRRDRRLPRRSAPTPSARNSPARCRARRPERGADARASRARPACCSTSSRSSTAPTGAGRARRCGRREMVVAHDARSSHALRLRATCCCRSRRSPRRSGTFVNIEGRVQSFHGVVKPLGEARPGWKVLRVLGNLLGLAGLRLRHRRAGARRRCLGGRRHRARCSPTGCDASAAPSREPRGGIERIADVPIYFADPLVRRSPPLQQTADARAPTARVNATLLAQLGLAAGAAGARRAGRGEACWRRARRRLPDGRACASPPAHPSTGGARARCSAPITRREAREGGMMLDVLDQSNAGSARPGARRSGRRSGRCVKIVAIVAAADALRRLPHAVGAQGHRLDAGAHRARTASARSGLLQPFADVLKLLIKEIIVPTDANKGLFLLAPMMTHRCRRSPPGR